MERWLRVVSVLFCALSVTEGTPLSLVTVPRKILSLLTPVDFLSASCVLGHCWALLHRLLSEPLAVSPVSWLLLHPREYDQELTWFMPWRWPLSCSFCSTCQEAIRLDLCAVLLSASHRSAPELASVRFRARSSPV